MRCSHCGHRRATQADFEARISPEFMCSLVGLSTAAPELLEAVSLAHDLPRCWHRDDATCAQWEAWEAEDSTALAAQQL